MAAPSSGAAVARRPGAVLPAARARRNGEGGDAGARVILGIESSCDDTAVAVVRARPGRPVGEILASEVDGQDALHAAYGGVVPEIAARAHAERLDLVDRRRARARPASASPTSTPSRSPPAPG